VEERGRGHASWGRRFGGLKDWWLLLVMAFGLCLFREKVDANAMSGKRMPCLVQCGSFAGARGFQTVELTRLVACEVCR
jgi:hypothetical protein